MILKDCLEMRESYLFREETAPWEREVISDPSTPKPDPNPFSYTLEGKSDVSFCFWKHVTVFCFLGYSLPWFIVINMFHFFPQHYFQMEDGVVNVYANKDCKPSRNLLIVPYYSFYDPWTIFLLLECSFFKVFHYFLFQQKTSFSQLLMQQPFLLICITYLE